LSDFKSRLGGYETSVINTELFSKTDPKAEMTLSLIHRFNVRLGGLLHMEREYIAHHIRRRNSGLEHLIASMQPEKHSEDYSKRSKDYKPEQRNQEASESTR